MHIIGKRCCWIAQLGLWKDVIFGMIEQLSMNVDPVFRKLAHPPCVHHGAEFLDCDYVKENADRIEGSVPLPPCPLYLHNCSGDAKFTSERSENPAWVPDEDAMSVGCQCDHNGCECWRSGSRAQEELMKKMCFEFGGIWPDDIWPSRMSEK